MSTWKRLIDMKKAVPVLLIVLLIVSSSGCFGGSALPTLKEELSSLDAALTKYEHAKDIYNDGDYQNAKQAFIDAVETFKACNSAFDGIAKTDISALEKRDAGNLAGCSKQFAYAAAYMRDACTEEMKPGSENAYLMKISADECELVARTVYNANREELLLAWSSK
jgi:hypothetical protein